MDNTDTVAHCEGTSSPLSNLLVLYDRSWAEETLDLLRYLESKKREAGRIFSLEKEIDILRMNTEDMTVDIKLNDNSKKVEEIYYSLKTREAMYETHLKCNLYYEQPNIYKFSFSNNSSVVGLIRFEHDQTKNTWTVLEIQPLNRIPKLTIDKFLEIKDTQGFLYHFRSRIYGE